MSNICICGLWHQGSVVSACLADMGHRVFGVQDSEEVVSRLRKGEPPVFEPKLKAIIRRNLKAGRLKYTTDFKKALSGVEFAYVSIDTPVGSDDESELGTIFETARQVAGAAEGSLILIISAQVPVGTCEKISAMASKENPGLDLKVVYVPEFLQLGSAIDTFRKADRFVVGTDDSEVAEKVADIYRPLGRPIILTNLRTAEMAKHASNAFLATSISFINEMASLCEEVGADAVQVAQIMKYDRRVGKYAFLSPGLGFAGGTLGREIRALQKLGHQHGRGTAMMDAVLSINNSRVGLVKQRLQRIYGRLSGLRVGILGLTYKPGTSTLRRAISLEIIRDLNREGVAVKAFDPLARYDEVAELPTFERCKDPYTAADGSDAVVLITEWSGIRELDFARLCAGMRHPVWIDTRNLLDPEKMEESGFTYFGIGRR